MHSRQEKRVLHISSFVASSLVGGRIGQIIAQTDGYRFDLVPTTIFGRHPGLGIPGGGAVSPELFTSILSGVRANLTPLCLNAIVCGYFASAEQVNETVKFLTWAKERNQNILIIIDPIIGDDINGKGRLYVSKTVAQSIQKHLIPIADIITPNRFELQWLSGHDPSSDNDLILAARDLCQKTVISSAQETAYSISTIIVEDHRAWRIDHAKFADVPKGTGDLLTSSLVSYLFKDISFIDASRATLARVHWIVAQSTHKETKDLALTSRDLHHPNDWPRAQRLDKNSPFLVVGLDGAPGGWVGFIYDMNGYQCPKIKLFEDFQSVVNTRARIIAVDMPIGLSDEHNNYFMRTCEYEARKLLGARRACIFPSPVRSALYADSYAEACALNRNISGRGLSKQTYNLNIKMRQIDTIMSPELENRVFETHPETIFTVLAGHPAQFNKKTDQGRRERLALLQSHGLHPDLFEKSTFKRKQCQHDDIIDAALCALTAMRIAQKRAKCFPAKPPRNGEGLRMAIWA